jgi:hypothetical protein
VIFDGTTMNDGVVSDTHVVANSSWCFLVGTMDDGTVLNVAAIAHSDIMYVAPHHGIEPNGTIIAHDYVAYYGGIRRLPAMLPKLGCNTPNG